MDAKVLKIYENDTEVSKNSCQFVVDTANQCIKDRGLFFIGVSGGSVAKFLCAELPSLTTDWSKWRMFFCDERHVPLDDPECTYTIYRDNLLTKVSLSEDHLYGDDPSLTVEASAVRYEKLIRQSFPDLADGEVPQFDLLLLGMGPDGHTCSLFPGHPLLKESDCLVAAISDSPKPPPERITMTLPLINTARAAVFISCGGGKAQMVQRVLEGRDSPPLPAALVRPSGAGARVYWFLDRPAASLLTHDNTAQL